MMPQPTYKMLASYDHLVIGKADMRSRSIDVDGIPGLVEWITAMVRRSYRDLLPLARHLRDRDPEQSKYNVWHFVTTNLRYTRDQLLPEGGYSEQPRTLLRTWADRRTGVDCEDYSAFTAALLMGMGLPAEFRVIKQDGRTWSHIYVVSGHTIIDRLLAFNREAHYTNIMKVQVLSGTNQAEDPRVTWMRMVDPHTRQALVQMMPYVQGFTDTGVVIWKPGAPVTDMDQMLAGHISDYHSGTPASLGALGLFRRRPPTNPQQPKPTRGVGHTLMKIMPVMILGRNSLLVMVRTNAFRLAQKLRLAYLTEEKAKKAKLNIDEWRKLRGRKEKIERTWYNLGGEVDALKKAIAAGAHVKVENLGEASTALIATAAPVLIGITAAIAGVDFKKLTKDSDDPSIGDQAVAGAVGNAVQGFIEKIKKGKNPEEMKMLESVQDAAADKPGESGGGTDSGGGGGSREDTSSDTNRPVWPWIVGGGVVLGVAGAIAWSVSKDN